MKSAIQILSDATSEPVSELEKCNEVQIIRPSECLEAMEEYAKKFTPVTGESEAIEFGEFLLNGDYVNKIENNVGVWASHTGDRQTTKQRYESFKKYKQSKK